MSFTEEHTPSINDEDRALLLKLARDSIKFGIKNGAPLPVHPIDFSHRLQQHQAAFVTLNQDGLLRGCIGHLEASQALVLDVVQNAYAASQNDPRFPRFRKCSEMDGLEIHISVLGSPEPMDFESEDDLVQQLVPGQDGLILEADGHRGTFLPSVWESLPSAREFFKQLKLKAGLPGNYWGDHIRVSRYHTESIA